MTNRMLFLSIWFLATANLVHADPPPNILIISIDDLNDWTGCLKGHPQARTPNIDRLAGQGTLFTNAHCQAPICTPSRASMVLGMYPSTTGLYFLQPRLEASKAARQHPTLLKHFADNGYHTMGAGKFVHGGSEGPHYQEYGGGMGGFGPLPKEKLAYPDGLKLWDWGPFPENEAEMPDTKVADFAIERLKKKHDKPFLLVAGFWRPHVPMFAPPKWFELFPGDEVKLPKIADDDLEDIAAYAKQLTIGLPAPRHEWFVKNNAWRDAVRAYLASVAFVDSCVGHVLDALDKSEYRDNTIVVLMSDHGWHLGEKQRWAKRSLWNDSTRVPLIVAAPNLRAGQVCNRPVGLIDIYPTLLSLTGKSELGHLEGRSLLPLLRKPDAEWGRSILTTYCPNNHSLRSENWHYIRYGDGGEELYNHRVDPHEWKNVSDRVEHESLVKKFRQQLPAKNAEPVISENWQRWEIEAWRAAEKLSN